MVLLAVLVTGVWLASRWWEIGYTGRNCIVNVGNGVFSFLVSTNNRHVPLGFSSERKLRPNIVFWLPPGRNYMILGSEYVSYSSYRLVFFNQVIERKAVYFSVAILFWPVPLLLLAGGVPMLRSGFIARRRSRDGLCKACGYDRRGLALEIKCPECGK